MIRKAILIFLCTVNVCYALVEIHTITNSKNIGDNNQVLAINNELTKLLTDKRRKVVTSNTDISEVNELANKLSQETRNQHVILASGKHGISALENLQTVSNKRVFLVWSGHQYYTELDRLIDKIDYIALPKHIEIGDIETKRTRFIATYGVSHAVTEDTLQQASKDPAINIPIGKTYIGVFLGGDAADRFGKMRYFPISESVNLAKYIAKEAMDNQAIVLVTNSPRTGRYNPNTGEEIVRKIDPVTSKFIGTLARFPVTYVFNNYKTKNAYQKYLATLKSHQGIAYVTGDSSSMISEIVDSLFPSKVFVVNVSSMNEAHHAHSQLYFNSGLINIISTIEEDAKVMFSDMKSIKFQPAANTIARHIIKKVV